MTTPLNTTEDDLQFELLLCLANTIEVIQRLHPTDASEIQKAGAFVTAPVKTSTTRDDPDAALVECLAYTIEAIHGLLLTGDGGERKSLERESEKVLNFTRGKWQPQSQERSFSLGSD